MKMRRIALRDRECPHCQSVVRTIDGEPLRQERKDTGLSLREVARRMGISAAYLSDLERLMWLYGQGFPKSLDISKAIDKEVGAERRRIAENPNARVRRSENGWGRPWQSDPSAAAKYMTAPATDAAREWSGWGTALKPAWEPILVAMKPTDGTFAQNAQRHGVAGLWIDGGRIGSGEGRNRVGEDSSGRRYTVRGSTNFSATPGPRGGDAGGRFPANLIIDEEAAALLDEQRGELASGVAVRHRSGGRTFGGESAKPPLVDLGYADRGGASRFFYVAKASRNERGEGNQHPTVKPLSLLRYLARLTRTPTGGVVLDPFAGSGTTALACHYEGRDCILIERERRWLDVARERYEEATSQALLPLDHTIGAVCIEPTACKP